MRFTRTAGFALFGAFTATLVKGQAPEYQGELLLTPQPIGGNTKCMTALSNNDGARVVIQTCTGAASQKWTFLNGAVRVFGNKCLDVTDGVNNDGTQLQIWTCYDWAPNQMWFYSKWDNTLEWAGRGKCVDLSEGSLNDGNPIQIWGCWNKNPNQIWSTGYRTDALPNQSQNGQSGTNNCGTGSNQSSNCQNAWINSADDFCLYGPPRLDVVGNIEREAVSYCTKSGRGTRVIPDGTLQGVHFVKTPEYVQITGRGDFTKINIPAGDDGGELDNRGADGKGNPIGGLVFGNTFAPNMQYHEWTEFISDEEFCIRACIGPRSKELCNHIYDVMGCWWNMPANYAGGVVEECEGPAATPMGVYGTSTWYQGVSPTPAPHPAPTSTGCTTLASVTVSPLRRSLQEGEEVRAVGDYVTPRVPEITASPEV